LSVFTKQSFAEWIYPRLLEFRTKGMISGSTIRLIAGGACAMSKVPRDDENRSPLSPVSGADDRFRFFFDAVADGIFVSNPATGRFIEINQPGCRMFGYAKSELIGRDIGTLSSGAHPYTLEMAIAWLEKSHLAGPQTFEWHCKTKDDVLFWAEISLRFVEFDHTPAVVSIVRDITERRGAQEARQEAATRLRTVVDTAVDGLILIDANGSVLMFNRACERLFGYRAEEMIGKNVNCLMPSPYQEEHDRYLENYHRTGKRKIIGIGREVVGRRNDGTTFAMDLSISETIEDVKTVFVGNIHNLTERKQAAVTEEKLTTILATINDIVWSIASDTYETLYLNPAAERIYGRPASAFYEDPNLFMNIVHPEDRPRVARMLPELIEKGTMTIQYRVVRPDGEVRWLEDKTAIGRDADGRPVRFNGMASDITERKAHEAHILYLATYDAVTDLPNRNLLSDRLTQAMAQAKRNGCTVSVLVLGLDRFKLINDSYGHGFGDALLRELAMRLRNSVRTGDTVARLRGDEFAVLISPLNNLEETIPAVRRLLDIFSHPFVIDHIEQYATASAGIALFPTDGSDPEILLKNAGAAMNRAKLLGRNGLQFFAPEMNAQATERLELEKALKQG
jgi:diguanylate cyclase (GGDEF)-like protein/PAS domain S-box-containing protein